MRCVWCGKEIIRKSKAQRFCSDKCRELEYNTTNEAKNKFRRLAKQYNLELDLKIMLELVKEKIAKYKKQYIRCSRCQERSMYCISPKCMADINTTGQCRCGMFRRKNNG